MGHWRALAAWREPRYLLAAAGPRTVPVELGAHYLAPGWGQALMPFSEFLAAHVLLGAAPAGAAARRGYLAQHDLFAQVHLSSDASMAWRACSMR